MVYTENEMILRALNDEETVERFYYKNVFKYREKDMLGEGKQFGEYDLENPTERTETIFCHEDIDIAYLEP